MAGLNYVQPALVAGAARFDVGTNGDELAAVRRPSKSGDRVQSGGPQSGFTAACRRHVGLGIVEQVLVRRTLRYEGDLGAIRRPDRRIVLVVALGKLTRLAANLHDEELPVAVAAPAQHVVPVFDTVDHLHHGGFLCIVVILRLVGVNVGNDRYALSVRRPGKVADAAMQIGDLNGLSTIRLHHPDLLALFVVGA